MLVIPFPSVIDWVYMQSTKNQHRGNQKQRTNQRDRKSQNAYTIASQRIRTHTISPLRLPHVGHFAFPFHHPAAQQQVVPVSCPSSVQIVDHLLHMAF